MYPPGVPISYDYPVVGLPRILDDAARDFPATTAIEYLSARITYRALLEQVDRFATALLMLGVGKGDRVAILLPTCPQHIVAIFATLRIGGVVSEHNPNLDLEPLARQLRDSQARVMVLLDRTARRLEAYREALPDTEYWVVTDLLGALPGPRRVLARLQWQRRQHGRGRRGWGSWEPWLDLHDLVASAPPSCAQASLDPVEDLALLLYPSSGTEPIRGVMLTHQSMIASAFQVRLWMPDVQAGSESLLCAEPFFLPYPLTASLMVGVLSAATLHLVPWTDPGPLRQAISKGRPTLLALSSARYADLVPDEGSVDLTSVRLALAAGGSLPEDVARRFEERSGAKLAEGYSLAQATSLTHANPFYGRAKRGGIGLPLPDTVAILLDAGDLSRPVSPESAGLLAISGPQVMRGYWRRPDDSAKDLGDGWLITRIRARMDHEGYFRLDA